MITRDRILAAISWWIGLVGLAGLMNLPPMHPAARRHCLLGLVGNAIFIWSGWRRPCGGSEGGWDFQRTSIQGERLGHLLVRVASRIFWDVNKEVEMPNKSFNTRIHPLFIVGFLIMVADLAAAAYWALEIQKPRAIALKAAGAWTWWDEILDKLILMGFWVIGYMGYVIQNLPEYGWSWKRAARSGLEAVISGAIVGALYALMAR